MVRLAGEARKISLLQNFQTGPGSYPALHSMGSEVEPSSLSGVGVKNEWR